jgi:hypothetical protein
VSKMAASCVQESARTCKCLLVYLQIFARISKSLQRTLRFLGANTGEKYPKEKSGEDRPIPTGAGSELRVIANLSPCLLRGISLSPQPLLSPSRGGFLEHARGPGAQSYRRPVGSRSKSKDPAVGCPRSSRKLQILSDPPVTASFNFYYHSMGKTPAS